MLVRLFPRDASNRRTTLKGQSVPSTASPNFLYHSSNDRHRQRLHSTAVSSAGALAAMSERRTHSAVQHRGAGPSSSSSDAAPPPRRIQSDARATTNGRSRANGKVGPSSEFDELDVKREHYDQQAQGEASSSRLPSSSSSTRRAPNGRRRSHSRQGSEEDAEGEGSSQRSKRPRTSQGDGNSDDEEEEEDGEKKPKIKPEKMAANGASDFEVAHGDRDREG